MKNTTLFNKNHIRVFTCEYSPTELKQAKDYLSRFYKDIDFENAHVVYTYKCDGKYSSSFDYSYMYLKEVKPIYKEIIHESPLGFYYKDFKLINGDALDTYHRRRRRPDMDYYKEFTILANNIEYNIVYFYANKNTQIGTEIRPWNICDNGMEEHFIYDLFDLLKKIKDNIDGVAKKKKPVFYGKESGQTFDNTWKEIMKDMFGYEDGPKFQTNDEKILAAGFDLKTSFRNM